MVNSKHNFITLYTEFWTDLFMYVLNFLLNTSSANRLGI